MVCDVSRVWLCYFAANIRMSQKVAKPTLTGQRIKTRKRGKCTVADHCCKVFLELILAKSLQTNTIEALLHQPSVIHCYSSVLKNELIWVVYCE